MTGEQLEAFVNSIFQNQVEHLLSPDMYATLVIRRLDKGTQKSDISVSSNDPKAPGSLELSARVLERSPEWPEFVKQETELGQIEQVASRPMIRPLEPLDQSGMDAR